MNFARLVTPPAIGRPAFLLLAGLPTLAVAQEVYGPTLEDRRYEQPPVPLVEAQPCADQVREDGAIVVCREREDPARYMSVLPAPVEVRSNQIDGLREPPCWVTGRQPCHRMGFAPPPALMIDLDAIPEALPQEQADLVYRAEEAAPAEAEAAPASD